MLTNVAQFQNSWMISLCHLLIQNKSITITSVTESFVHQCYSVSTDFNEAFEFICKDDYLDLFHFEPGILYL